MSVLDSETLKRIQQIETDMLKEFVSVCEKLNLPYFLLGGTLLGAIRHQGFIPWDDDIDIGMLRKDYEVFLAKAPALLPSHLFLQTNISDPCWYANFSKIRNSNTTFIETSSAHLPIHHGVFIDIFPLDDYPKSKLQQKIFSIKNRWYIKKIYSAFVLNENNGKKTAKESVVSVLHKLTFLTTEKAVQKREKLLKNCNDAVLVANHCGAWGKKEIVPKEWYGKGCKVVFEGIQTTVPEHYENWLTQVYGDYRKLPPEEKRVTHHFTEVIDLDTPYTAYTTKG